MYYSEQMTRGMAVVPLHVMTNNGFYARLMKAPKLTGPGTHALPPGESIPVFPVDAFLGAPDNWVKGPGSYICPVDSEWGLWFDWTMNDQPNTAVIPSVKGMNPITGQKIEGLALERYSNKCPIHRKSFKGDDRLCEECGYCWPPQNYVCSPNTLWWDGFRAADGTVRQFFFSKEDEKDIASAVIGKHNTVPAFGFCFYRPKKMHVAQARLSRGILYASGSGSAYAEGSGATGPIGPTGPMGLNGYLSKGKAGGQTKGMKGIVEPQAFYSPLHTSQIVTTNFSMPSNIGAGAAENFSTMDSFVSADCSMPVASGGAAYAEETEEKTSGGIVLHDMISEKESREMQRRQDAAQARHDKEENEIKTVSVGAGAKIEQYLQPDKQASVKAWRKKNGGIIRLYFCFKPQFAQILSGGVKDLKGEKEGYLKGLPVEI